MTMNGTGWEMARRFVKFLMTLFLILFISTGCTDDINEKQNSIEIDTLKKEIDVLKDSIDRNLQMQVEIDYLKEEIERLKAKHDLNLEASVYSYTINDKDIEVTIDFRIENDVNRDISFFVLSGNIKNQLISGDHVVIGYDEALVPGKGTVGTDDVPENVKRYRIVFPSRNDYVFLIIAVDKNSGSMWNYEINSSMEGDI